MRPVLISLSLKDKEAAGALLRRFLALGWKPAPLGARVEWGGLEVEFAGGTGESPAVVTFKRTGQRFLHLREYTPLPRAALEAVSRVWRAYQTLSGAPPEGVLTTVMGDRVVDARFSTLEALEGMRWG